MASTDISAPTTSLFGRVNLFADESVPGAVIRLAQVNRVPVLSWLFELAAGVTGKTYHLLPDLIADYAALEHIAMLAHWDAQAFASRAWRPHTTTSEPYLHFERMVHPRDSIMTHRGQFCPACLRDAAYWRSDWDLAHVTACPRHGNWLVDACPNCGKLISLSRATLCHCRYCGADYRGAVASSAPRTVLDVTEDVAALAPIRLGYPGHLHVEAYETLFLLIRLLATRNEDLWNCRKVAADFSTRPLHERRVGVERIAICREGFSYRADKIMGALAQVFEHLDVIPKEHAIRDRIECSLAGSRLLAPTQRILLHGDTEPLTPFAVRRLHGDLPYCRSLQEAACYLGIDPIECSALVRRHLLSLPCAQECFDADELLTARDFLDSLLSVQELDRLTGLPGLGPELVRTHLLEQWSYPEGTPARYTLESVIALQDRLRLAVHKRAGCMGIMSLGEMLKQWCLDARAAAAILAQVVSLGVSPVAWSAPWRLMDLCFESTDEALQRFKNETTHVADAMEPRGAPSPSGVDQRAVRENLVS